MSDRGVPTGKWKATLPKRARVQLASKVGVECVECMTIRNLGTNEDGTTVCLSCWSGGGMGFAWWRS